MTGPEDTTTWTLGYEINLECATCGHAQFLHCDNHSDPCGCIPIPARGGRPERRCPCPAFVRPPGARPVLPGVWMEHDHDEEESA